jgi:hypothetical protein
MGESYREVPIRGPAGTAFIYNIATYLGRMAGTYIHGGHTLHAYYSHDSRPVLTNFSRECWVWMAPRSAPKTCPSC